MTNEVKIDISTAANAYIREKKLTAASFSPLCKVNESYLSRILNGVFTYIGTNEAVVDIPDKYFVMIAEAVGYSIKKEYWPHINTREFTELVTALKKAKDGQLMSQLIVDTGAGKTYAINQFRKVNPLHTYVITMHSLLKINDLFGDLIDQLKISSKGSTGYRRAQILIKLREIRRNGGNPIVIIDEGENMNSKMRGMIKGFYDGISGYASIVMVGTPDLWEHVTDAKSKGKEAGPQYARRFKAGTRFIKITQSTSVRFKPFFEALNLPKGLQKLLCDLCDNYGELHDYLVPALMEADSKGVALTESFFRLMYNIPE